MRWVERFDPDVHLIDGLDLSHAKVTGRTYTAFNDEQIIAFSGVLERWEGYGTAWTYILTKDRYDLLFITRAVKSFIETCCDYRRLELTVAKDFDAGHRWATLLGFSPEGVMRRYDPSGRDHVLYARINPSWHQPHYSSAPLSEPQAAWFRESRPSSRATSRPTSHGRTPKRLRSGHRLRKFAFAEANLAE